MKSHWNKVNFYSVQQFKILISFNFHVKHNFSFIKLVLVNTDYLNLVFILTSLTKFDINNLQYVPHALLKLWFGCEESFTVTIVILKLL